MGVLDDMTRGITDRKASKSGASLTPVGVEGSPTKPSLVGIPEVPEVFLTNEAITDIAKDLRRQAGVLIEVANGLDKLTESPTVVEEKVDTKALQKAAEKAADEKFAERLERLKSEAQAAVFAASDDDPSPQPAAAAAAIAGGWACPEHGDEDIEQLTSRLRPSGYRACSVAGCGEFEPKG